MSATDQMYFRAKVMRYKSSYDKDGDGNRYFANVTVSAVSLWLAEQNELRKRMGKAGLVLPTALSMSSPLFMAAMDAVADHIHCPVDQRMSALEFLNHLGERIKKRYESEYVDPVKEALKTVHDALHSLGLLARPTCQHCRKSIQASDLITHKCCGKHFCNDCSNKMRIPVPIPGSRFLLRCDCGASRVIDMGPPS